MVSTSAMASVGAVALVGIGLGVHLGNTATAMIAPSFAAEPAPRFYSALAANQPARSMQYGYAPVASSGYSACVGCRTFPEEYRPGASYEDYLEDGYAASIGAQNGYREPDSSQSETAAVEVTPDPEIERIALYSSYAVDAGETEPATAEPEVVAYEEIEGQPAPSGM